MPKEVTRLVETACRRVTTSRKKRLLNLKLNILRSILLTDIPDLQSKHIGIILLL